MGFMPAVELSYIKPENQRLIAVSIDGRWRPPRSSRQSGSGSLTRRACSTAMSLTAFLSEEKREVDNVIISTDETQQVFRQGGHSCQNESTDYSLDCDQWLRGRTTEMAIR